MKEAFNPALAEAFASARITPDSIAWFEHNKKRKFAPLPPAKLRRLAQRAGFKSSVEFLHAEAKHG
jgi:hypothetical protein